MQYNYHSQKSKAPENQFFKFEQDFVEDGIKCIPMIVRFKLDLAGIKLKLKEWSFFDEAERELLAFLPCHLPNEIACYRDILIRLIKNKCGTVPGYVHIDKTPSWTVTDRIDPIINEQAGKYNIEISIKQWSSLNTLQRFALLKLCRPGHENRNFPIAVKEFLLV